MSKELRPLEHLDFIRHYEIDDEHRTLNDNYACRQSLDIIETALKALEIIIEKRVNVDNFLRHIKKDTDYKEYKRLCGLYKIMVFSDKDLTQEEYDILKEVLL